MKNIWIVGFCVFSTMPFLAFAGPIVRSGETISVDATQILEEDFYALSPTVSVSGVAKNDVYIVGGKITINTSVNEDLSLFGGTVQVHGEVGDDLRVIGGDVVLAAPVKGDVFVIGGTLEILSTALIDGDVIFYGNKLTITGDVAGTIHGSSEYIRIDSQIGKGVDYTATHSFILGDKAHILGDITYKGDIEILRSTNALITGKIQKIELPTQKSSEAQAYALMGISILFSTFLFYFISPRVIRYFTEKSDMHIGMYGLIGLGVLITAPFIVVLLALSVVGIALSIFIFSGYIAVVIVAFILGIIALGSIVQKTLFKKDQISIITPIVGSIVCITMLSIPIVRIFFILALISISLGIIAHSGYHKIRS